jgi:NADPH:quinone reductase-like Zn-dependent oxidoreductase
MIRSKLARVTFGGRHYRRLAHESYLWRRHERFTRAEEEGGFLMKAVVIRNQGKGLEAWKLVERPDPTPGPGQVLVRLRAASLNYRDLLMARGEYGGPLKPDLVALADGAGEIAAVGAGVTRWKVGDRVCAAYYPTWQSGPLRASYRDEALGAGSVDGTLAQYIALPETGVVRIPAHLSYEEAATLPCAALTAWTALFVQAPRLAPGSTVLVQGTGGVSIFAAQLARAAGLRVIGTSSSAAKLERLRALGVDGLINYREQPDWQKEVLRLTGGEGVDQVIEVGGAGTLARSFEAAKEGGTVSLIGVLTGFGGEVSPIPVLLKALRFEGVIVGSVESFEQMNRAIEATGLRPVVDEVFALERAPAALAKLAEGKHFGKIVVRID